MLHGSVITLRPVRQADLDYLYERHLDIDNRGEFFPRGIVGESTFRRRFEDDGLWSKDEGMLVITAPEGAVLGHIEFYKTVNYLDEFEFSYHLYETKARGRGATSEAVTLLTRYLFETRQVNRIRLVIHPGNAASRRVAEKCGFRHEGTARGAWYNRGRHHDVEIYAILHSDVIGG